MLISNCNKNATGVTLQYKSIVFGEAVRLRRLHEKQKQFLESLESLKEKCYLSDFNKKLTNKIINLASELTDRFNSKITKRKKISRNSVDHTFPQTFKTHKQRQNY